MNHHYDHRLPPDTFLARRDSNWYIGAAPGHKLPVDVIQKTIAAIMAINQSAKTITDTFIRETTNASSLADLQAFEKVSRKLFGESAALRWAENFTQSVESMAIRMITVTPSGFYPWEVTPKLITDLADFVDQESKFMLASARDLVSVSGQASNALRAMARAVLDASASALLAATKKAMEVAEELGAAAAKRPLGFAIVAAGAVGVLALYFYINKKR